MMVIHVTHFGIFGYLQDGPAFFANLQDSNLTIVVW